jgi:hypothetical protein
MPFRLSRRKSLGGGFWLGVSKSGLSAGRRGRRVSTSMSRRGPQASIRLLKGLSYVFRPKHVSLLGSADAASHASGPGATRGGVGSPVR